jgi:uncharacterized protein YecE (DUF72 family)
MRLFTGTSGFAYKEWKGSFYPQDLPASGMLRFYAERFPAVEINNTFYRIPKVTVLEQWATQVPAGFVFVLKASQAITHRARLRDVAEPTGHFFRTAAVLGDRLGPVLVQLPPNLKKDLPRLEAFLDVVPAGRRVALEFRHASWFDDDVFSALRAAGAALCVAHTDDLDTPFVATADWGYLRLRNVAYTDADLAAWADRIRAAPWSDAFAFFKHEDEGTGPKLAVRFEAVFRSGQPGLDPRHSPG